LEAAWLIRKYYNKQRDTVHSRNNEEVVLNTRNRYKVVNGLLLTDKWPNRKDELGLRAIFKNVH